MRLKCNFLKAKIPAFAFLLVFGLSIQAFAPACTVRSPANEEYPGQKVIEYLNLDALEYLRQKEFKKSGLQEIAPVMLPEGKFEALGEAEDYHFGWPHAGIIDDVLFAGFRLDQPRSVIVRSTDGGKTWEEPLFLENARIMVFGSTESGKVVAAAGNSQKSNTLSVLTSADKGKTWERHNASVANMPRVLHARMVEHPQFGLITGGHFTTIDSLKLLQSKDEGKTWRSVSFHIDQPIHNNGTVVFLDGDNNLGVFVRNHAGFGEWKSFAQFTAVNQDTADRFEDLIWKGKYTNQWVRKTDGSDAVYNPVSKRIEAVTTKRDWGFPHVDRGYMTLNLWSISPESFHKGEGFWRYEGTILKSGGEKARIVNPRDGMHPVGSVIDEKRGVQHIFIYSGDRAHGGNPAAPNTGRTGIFRITRTLDTEKWVEKNRELENYKKIYQVNEDFNTLAQWNKSGSPAGGEMIIPRTEPPYRVEVNFPGGDMKADARGHLYIKTGKPGYYGLHNEQIIATSNFRVEFKAKINEFPSSGYPLAIAVNCGAEKNDVIIKADGIYQFAGEEMEDLKKMIDVSVDNEWHTWEVVVKKGEAKISMDGEIIGKGFTRIDGRLGHRPISISAMTTREDDVAEAVVDYFRFENIEL